MRPVMIVFAKAPVPGCAKTRLTGALTANEAAMLHDAFVRDTLELLQPFAAIADLELHTDIETDAWRDLPVPRRLQHEGDLGLKMFKALEGALQIGRPRAWILGSDSPALPGDHLHELLRLDADVVLGPTEDGGYYAIGAHRTNREMFRNVRWSTVAVLEDTIKACIGSGLTTALGPVWFDVDELADLRKLRNSKDLRQHTAAALGRLTVSAREAISACGGKRA